MNALATRAGAATPPARLVIRPLGGALGAEVIGLDVARRLPPDAHSRLEEAFHAYKLLCFRDQLLTTDSLAAFARTWGVPGACAMPGRPRNTTWDVAIESNADALGRPNGSAPGLTDGLWHTDSSWRRDPGAATLLYGVEVPAEGGDTLFANTAKAYEALPQPLKDAVTPMTVLHSEMPTRGRRFEPEAAHDCGAPAQRHPLTRVHPVTGERALFIGCHASGIEGMPEAEGRELLDDLLEFATKPEFVYRHLWRRRDLLMWDDRCTLHVHMPYDAARELRTTYRTVVAGRTTR